MQIMLKKFHHNEKHLKCAGASLSLQIVLLVLTTSIPEGTGGSDDGDPAPGRSPGPPLQGWVYIIYYIHYHFKIFSLWQFTKQKLKRCHINLIKRSTFLGK